MSPFTTSLIEWISTLLSIAGFWLCIRHRSSCFAVFLVADVGWLASAWMNGHASLLAQQVVYILLNVVGYVMWRRDERIELRLKQIEERPLEAAGTTRGGVIPGPLATPLLFPPLDDEA
jgi:nicotinamide riboside transporter PnuC